MSPLRGVHLFVVLAALTVAAPAVWGAPGDVVVANTSSAASSGRQSNLSWSHTVSAGSDRLLLVGFTRDTAANGVSSITYGGTNLTRLGAFAGSSEQLEIWYLVAPTVGTATISVSYNSAHGVGGALTLTNVHQTTPLGTFTTASASSNAPSVVVSSASYELVFDVMVSGATPTVGANQTQQWNHTSNNARTGSSTADGASSVTMSWSLASSTSWAQAAVAVKPANTPPTITDIASQSTDISTSTPAIAFTIGDA